MRRVILRLNENLQNDTLTLRISALSNWNIIIRWNHNLKSFAFEHTFFQRCHVEYHWNYMSTSNFQFFIILHIFGRILAIDLSIFISSYCPYFRLSSKFCMTKYYKQNHRNTDIRYAQGHAFISPRKFKRI